MRNIRFLYTYAYDIISDRIWQEHSCITLGGIYVMLSTSSICILVTIVAYLLIVLLIGFHYAKVNESASDFYLGGRKLGPLVTAMSAEASDMSSYLLMGLPGLAYLSGLADVGWTAIGLAIGTYLNWLFTAKRLRRYTHATKSFTLPQFFSNRYRDKKNICL